MTITTFLLVLAFVLLVLRAVNCPAPARLDFGWAGMAIWLFTLVIGGIRL